jgi:hypothetical protein
MCMHGTASESRQLFSVSVCAYSRNSHSARWHPPSSLDTVCVPPLRPSSRCHYRSGMFRSWSMGSYAGVSCRLLFFLPVFVTESGRPILIGLMPELQHPHTCGTEHTFCPGWPYCNVEVGVVIVLNTLLRVFKSFLVWQPVICSVPTLPGHPMAPDHAAFHWQRNAHT